MATTRELLDNLSHFERQPQSAGFDLRFDLSKIVLREIARKGWTQKQLAEAAGMKESFITRIVHGATNCTFEVAGRILFALHIKAKLIEDEAVEQASTVPARHHLTFLQESTNGDEEIIKGDTREQA